MTGQIFRHADFRHIDLNLLVVFDALMEERHVGKAAARACISQPAMSYALSRLREALDDDLFVRSTTKMEPTALALELAPSVRAWLDEANSFLFASDAFDLSRVDLTIRIATIAGIESVLLPPLMAALHDVAPGIHVWSKQLHRNEILPGLDAEEIDLVIGPRQLPFMEQHCFDLISVSGWDCVFSPDQLNLPDEITPEILAEHEHLALSWRGDGGSEIDHFFEAHGLPRKVAATVTCQLAAVRILQQFPVLTLQSSMSWSVYCNLPGIAIRPITAKGFAGFALQMGLIWHRRNDKNPAHAYVRKIVKEILISEDARIKNERKTMV